MTRKDTILVAVIVNAAILAVLFATAIIYDTDKISTPSEEVATPVVAEAAPQTESSSADVIASNVQEVDEVDRVLSDYAEGAVQKTPEPEAEKETVVVEAEAPQPAPSEKFVEITVKKGDVLEKIAKNNKSTVSAIKKANNLANEKLKIGQVLKVPLKKAESTAVANAEVKKSEAPSEAVYHVVKSGDSPWKVAKQYNVKYEDILKLNGITEEKARNLKIGEKIRVK